MKLKLNELITSQIEWDNKVAFSRVISIIHDLQKIYNNALTDDELKALIDRYYSVFFNKAINIIHDLEKLYNLDTLSDDELKVLINKYYPFALTDSDTERIIKSILKTNNIECSELETDIITMVSSESQELSYLDATVYYAKDSDIDLTRIYTFDELQELINSRKIVVESLDWDRANKFVTKKAVSIADLTREYKIPTIDKISHRDFCNYDDIILPLIKKHLTKSKVNKDIMRIINLLRVKLREDYKNLGIAKWIYTYKERLSEITVESSNKAR